MHNLLIRQLRRHFGDPFSVPKEWVKFLSAVNDAYLESDSDRKMIERSLDLSSQELLHANSGMRAIFQAIPDLMFRLDSESKILDYEAGSTEDLFLQPKDLIGKQIQNVPLKKVGNEFSNAILKVRETRAVANLEYSLKIRNQKQYYDARILPLLDDQIIIIIRNITMRKHSEEEIKESQQRLVDIINFLPDATFVIDKEGKVIAWNRAIQEMTGISAENMLGEGDYKYALPFYGERRPILIDLVLRPEQKIEVKYMRIERRDKILVGETYVPALRGSELFLLGTACTLHDSGGNVVGAIQSIRDITKGKRAEEAIIRAEEKYRSIFENAVMGIFQTSPEGRILSANPAFARILGYDSPEDVINNLTDISRQMYADPNRRSELLRLTEERDTLGEFELRALRKDGSSIWLTLNVRAVRDINGKLIYLDGSAQDITDRKLLESRLLHSQKMEAIGTLAGGIAHDFNNILSAILGYCEMTKMNLNQPKLQGYMEQVIKASDRAKNLVQQILTFSRKAEKEIKPVDMVLLTKEALTMLRATVPSTIRISEEIDKGVHTVIADPTQVHQILVNLCTNAAFAMREKGGVLKIGLCNVEIHQDITTFNSDLHPGIYLKLTVSDTGIGIAPEIIHRIFDPFFTTKKKRRRHGAWAFGSLWNR
ncbi:MAG: PAS domain S-box protein [Pseudomonadota bacterium]